MEKLILITIIDGHLKKISPIKVTYILSNFETHVFRQNSFFLSLLLAFLERQFLVAKCMALDYTRANVL